MLSSVCAYNLIANTHDTIGIESTPSASCERERARVPPTECVDRFAVSQSDENATCVWVGAQHDTTRQHGTTASYVVTAIASLAAGFAIEIARAQNVRAIYGENPLCTALFGGTRSTFTNRRTRSTQHSNATYINVHVHECILYPALAH